MDNIGDGCDDDVDGDTIANLADSCPGTAKNAVVLASGCSVDQECPCGDPWAAHDDYVTCVQDSVAQLVTDGVLESAEGNAMVRTASESECGNGPARRSADERTGVPVENASTSHAAFKTPASPSSRGVGLGVGLTLVALVCAVALLLLRRKSPLGNDAGAGM